MVQKGVEKEEMRNKKNLFLVSLVILFMSLGSFGTVALANYTNVTIEASVVNVRLGPGLSYDIMTQVQGGTVVNVLAEKNEWYKVRLSDGRIGWIASWLINNTEVSASQNLVATVLESSVNVREENSSDSEIVGTAVAGDKFNLLYEEDGWSQIHYDNRVAWILSELIEISPGTIEGAEETAVSQSAPSTEPETAGEGNKKITVAYDDVNIRTGPSLDDDILTIANTGESFNYLSQEADFFEVQMTDGQVGYIASWLVQDHSSENEMSLPATQTTLSEATIVLDPGHGGTDPGAEGTSFYEKEVTLQTAETIAEKLRSAGANVILTRSADEDVSLEERAWMSSNNQADLFISIHYDSTPEGVYGTGVTTYYYQDQQMPLADLMNGKLMENLPLENNGTRFGNYLVLRENTQPALLLELGYINNDNDADTFNTSSYRSQVADSIYEALTEYFN